MIEIRDAVEKTVVATGNAIVILPGEGNRGVTNCQAAAGQRLQTNYSYNLVNTVTHESLSAECTALPGLGMMTASFHLN